MASALPETLNPDLVLDDMIPLHGHENAGKWCNGLHRHHTVSLDKRMFSAVKLLIVWFYSLPLCVCAVITVEVCYQ